ncbi:hypothetical protein [uncultured Winogradskyella sp.]|uniref:hypothetical protein n=1 Tax=uncultured Winogradskyella sp. TaxID=395353 RepID=UPI00261C2292|nr:hypothetical protein [uncultured Winogradskyella sp.]
MKKKKCFVLIISERFPKTHPRAGEETKFYKKILQLLKKHTIRMNYELWKNRVELINKGEAYLSIRTWSGKPYRSPQVELIDFHNVGLQKLEANIMGWFIDDYDSEITTKELSENDGLSLDDFKSWFKKIPQEPMALIHFTDFRYPNSKNESVSFKILSE